ncbi:C-C motif chemokine 2-like [Pygocentrus nattereri]|uniref:C-C motif chemokine 2-like n=1 Tax=Pygocentrus nattereri TaxID=42514 RepID=UPI000814A1A2|nr:C-C motif chemokine 2-like [Pygocentrus nattereri]
MNLHLAVCFLCVAAFSSALAQSRRPSNCCLRVSRITVRLDNILDYRWQDKGLCPVTAVVFETRSGNKICSDPNRDWTKRAMSKVAKDKERKEAEKSKKELHCTATLTSDSPAEGNGEGAYPPTPPKLPANSRWLQESAVSAAPKKQHEPEGSVKSTKARQGSKNQGKGGKKKKNRVRKRKVKKTSQ